MRRCSTCSLPDCASSPPRARLMAIRGVPSSRTLKSLMAMSSACRSSGGSICGNTSGQRGSSNGVSLRGRSSVAPLTSNAVKYSRLPSKGRRDGSSITLSASNTIVPISQLACGVGVHSGSRWRGIEKCTSRKINGPDAGPSALPQVSCVPAGKRDLICASNTLRPPTVITSQYSSTPTSSANATIPTPLRSASFLRRVLHSVAISVMRASRCSLVASLASGARPNRRWR